MSREIDERVVQMKFEKGEFEKNIQTSIYKLDELKKGLDFKDATKGFEDLDEAARKTDISALGKAVEQVQLKFGLFEVFALRVMTRISDAAINAGEKLVKSLTIDQVTPGWDKYAQKTSSVQTIMAATANQFSDTAEQMEVVNEQLNKLNWFTDETSYNFVDMVNNIGKFTSNNIALDQSVTAMQGIANWAAISGANAQEASRAMYNLAQALATGTVKLIDWKSIENANMATTEFKQTVIDIATELGTLKKVGEDVWTTIDGKVQVSAANFNEGLSKGWFTNEVLMRSLNRYGAAAEKLNEVYEKLGANVTTSRIVSSIEKYTNALGVARKEAQEFGLDVEATNKKVAKAGEEVAKDIAESWGVSLEEATEMLAAFDDETMQFGLKAFKAAQEAKTFQEAIDSVKDAVSTGWMKTFELLFGSYTEAKVLWTNLANTLYDIFATSGDLRNEMLEEWAEEGGRKYFTDTIYATLAAIMSILSPIKQAWEATFGTMTASTLLDITVRLHDFVLSLVQTEESMQKIARIFRGAFSVLDIFKTIITQIIQGGLSVLSKILAELNIDVGEFAAKIGDGIFELRLWFKHSNLIVGIFDKLGNGIVFAIRMVKGFIEAVKEFGPIKALINGLSAAFTGDFKGISGIFEGISNAFKKMHDYIETFGVPKSAEEFIAFFKTLGSTIKQSLKEVGVDLDNLLGSFAKFGQSMFAEAGNIMQWIISGFLKGVTTYGSYIINAAKALVSLFIGAFEKKLDINSPSKVMEKEGGYVVKGLAKGILNSKDAEEAIKSKVDAIVNIFKNIDWAGVLLVGSGVVILTSLWKIADALTSFGKALENVTGVGKSAKGAFDSIKGYFDALKKNVQTNNILKIAISVTMLAVAFGLISRLEWDQVKNGAVAIGVMAVALGALTAVLTVLNKMGFSAAGSSGFLMAIAGSVLLLVMALRMIPASDEFISLNARLGALFTTTLIFIGVAGALSLLSRAVPGNMSNLLAMSASIFILIQAMKSIGQENILSIYAAAPVVAALMGVLALISKLMTYQKSMQSVTDAGKTTIKYGASFATTIGIVMGLILLIQAIKMLGKMDPAVALQGIILSIPVVIMLGQLFKAAQNAGRYASSAGKMIFFLAAGMAILIPVLKAFANMDLGILVKGGITITLLSTAILLPLISLSKDAGQYAGKAGLMILEIAASLAIIQLVVKTLGKMDLFTLAKGVVAVAVLIGSLAIAIEAMNSRVAANENTVKAFSKLLIIVGILSAVILAMSILNPNGALIASAGLAAVFVSLGYMFKLIDKIKLPDMKQLGVMVGMIGMIGFVVGLISFLSNWEEILSICTGLSLVMVALASMTQILKNSATSDELKKKLTYLGVFLAGLTGIMAGIAGIAYLFGQGDAPGKITDLIAITVAISGLAIAAGVFGKLLGKLSLPTARQMVPLYAFISYLAVLVGIMAAVLASTSTSGLDISGLLYLTTGMAEVMLAMAAAIRIMSGVKTPERNVEQIVSMGVIITIMGGILAILAPIVSKYDMSQFLTFTTGLSEVLIVLGSATAVMGLTDYKLSITNAVAMGGLIFAIGGTLALFSTMVDPNTVLPLAVGMSAVLIAISVAALILSAVPEGSFAGAIEGIGIAIIFVGLMTALMGLISLFVKDVGDIERAADAMIQVGRGIGGFIGGVYGGFVEGFSSGFPGICANISEGMANLMPFFGYLEEIPGGILGFIASLVGAVGAMTAAEFIAGLKSLPGLGAILRRGSDTLASDFKSFGEAIKAFSDALGDNFNGENVKNAAIALVALAGIEKDMKGIRALITGLADKIFGTDNIAEFGKRLEKLGESVKTFARQVDGIKPNVAKNAETISKTFIELEKGLPRKGGILQTFFGEVDISQFGLRLVTFGNSLRLFAGLVQNITADSLKGAISVTKDLVAIENSLSPNGDGWYLSGFLFGDRDLGDFGSRLMAYGAALVDFTNKVSEISDEDITAIENAQTITKQLIDLEKDVDESGGLKGMIFGKDDLATLGVNLESFAQSLVNFSAKLESTNIEQMKNAVEFIRDLVGLQDIDNVKADAVAAAETILDDIKTTIANSERSIKLKGANVIYWLARGLEDGASNYSYIVSNAAKQIAQNLIDTFEDELEIHSPSLVMNEEGHWVVKGLGEGITQETAAEEAMAKKAQNLVSAFEAAFNKLTSKETTSNLEFQLWKLTEGKAASEVEIAQKQLEIENQKLAHLAQIVAGRREAMEAIAKISGEDSEEYQKAYQNYLQAQIDMLTKQNEIDSTYGGATIAATATDKAIAFAKYMKENAQAYELLGKTQDELEAAAYKAIYGLDEAALSRKKAYEELMTSFREDYERMNTTWDELDRMSREATGWEGVNIAVNSSMSDTAKIIEANINSYSIDLEESLEMAAAEIIENSTKNGSSASGAAIAGGASLGNDLASSFTETISQALSGTGNAVSESLEGSGLLESIMSYWTGESSLLAANLGSVFDSSYITGISEDAQDVVNSIYEYVVQPSSDSLAGLYEIAKEYGGEYVMGFVDGIKNGAARKAVQDAINSALVGTAIGTTTSGLDEHSPSRVAFSFGSFFTEGFAIGIRDKANLVRNAATNMVDSARNPLSYAAEAIENILNTDDDFRPVITPILDMDDLKEQASGIPGLLGTDRRISVNSARLRVAQIEAANTEVANQNGSGKTNTQTNYNFVQNNYSPKALSRAEIYRQTNNQFSRIKERTKS